MEFIRMRPECHGIHLILLLVVDPGLDEFFGKDVTL
jgi:hypothetical protein